MKTSSNHSTSHTSSNEEIKPPNSSLYKGVVPGHNGRWGAQIYERRRRIWLGSFTDEKEAAKAYDIAAQRFRGSEAVTNFTRMSGLNPDDQAELAFLSVNSKEEIVDMLKKHTYTQELKNSLKSRVVTSYSGEEMISRDKYEREYLFHKAVTPSDVGKLNRFVVPKIHAEKYFQNGVDRKGVSMSFEDREGKKWRFRYSYCKSSHIYVLTKGWSQLVREKGMKAGDVVTFWRASNGSGFTKLLIDCKILERENYTYSRVDKSFGLHGCESCDDMQK